MYRKTIWQSADKNFLIIKKYHAAHFEPVKEKNKERRKPRKESTTWKQEEINRRRRTENIQRLLLDNFRPGDWYLTLTYKTGSLPDTEEQAREQFTKFKRSLRGFYNKQKLACQWIGIIEHLKCGGRTHMHIILPALDPQHMQTLKKLWPHGNVDIRFYGGTQLDAYRLASYYTKETTEATASAVMSSRNLLRSEPKDKTETADTWRDDITPPAGYEIVKQLTYKTTTEAGYPLQKIVLQKINPEYLPRPPLQPKKGSKKNGISKKTTSQTIQRQAPTQAPGRTKDSRRIHPGSQAGT